MRDYTMSLDYLNKLNKLNYRTFGRLRVTFFIFEYKKSMK